MSGRYIVKLSNTDLWLERHMVIGYGSHTNYSHDWVLSPLNASRFETIKGATECAEKGVPIGHFEVFRLLEKVEPIGTRDEPIQEVQVKYVEVSKPRRNAWYRFWCGE